MIDKTTESLNQIFEIEGELVDVEPKSKQVIEKVIEGQDDITKDYNYARDNLYGVIDQGSQALEYLLELAKASEHPRAFEVVGSLTKTLVDANKDLLDIQKKVKELKKDDGDANPATQNVTNALFVGSTADLQKLIKGEDD